MLGPFLLVEHLLKAQVGIPRDLINIFSELKEMVPGTGLEPGHFS